MTNLFISAVITWPEDGSLTPYSDPVVVGTPSDNFKPTFSTAGGIGIYAGTVVPLVTSTTPTLDLAGSQIILTTSAVPPTGALTEFAIWDALAPGDPHEVYVQSPTHNNSGNAGAAWTRHSAIMALPARARYLGVGGKFVQMPGNDTSNRHQHLGKVQLEVAPISGIVTVPSPYTDPREVRTIVHPDRLNWAPNPNFWVNTDYWAGLTRAANSVSRSGWVGQVTLAANEVKTVTFTLPIVMSAETHLIKTMVVASAGNSNTVNPISVSTGTIVGSKMAVATVGHPYPVQTLFRPVKAGFGTILTYRVVAGSVPTTISFFETLVEKTDKYDREYFDGATSGDTVWEDGVAAGRGRSYYYKNRTERFAAIRRVLEENVPMGIGVADPLFGGLPAYAPEV